MTTVFYVICNIWLQTILSHVWLLTISGPYFSVLNDFYFILLCRAWLCQSKSSVYDVWVCCLHRLEYFNNNVTAHAFSFLVPHIPETKYWNSFSVSMPYRSDFCCQSELNMNGTANSTSLSKLVELILILQICSSFSSTVISYWL